MTTLQKTRTVPPNPPQLTDRSQVCTDRILLHRSVYDWSSEEIAGRLPRERQQTLKLRELAKIGSHRPATR